MAKLWDKLLLKQQTWHEEQRVSRERCYRLVVLMLRQSLHHLARRS